MSASIPRSHIDDETHPYVSPHAEINAGIWTLFIGASIFLGLRLWCKVSRRHGTGMWYDDYILIASWLILFMNDILISVEYATGYVQDDWDDRMRIMINISSCGTLIGQALTKTAFAVTLLRISNRYLQWVLWFCIITMHLYMFAKVLLQWGKVCGKEVYDVYYRLDFCVTDDFRDQVKEGGNVYNLLMDFVFAVFPWLITWKLNIGRREKISLCITLSLGMIIAISTAVRTAWKDDDVEHDEWYFWNNAMSQIWFSSEVCGTIIVQCVPILRPFLKEVTPTFSSSFAKRSRGQSTITKLSQKERRGSIPLRSMQSSHDPESGLKDPSQFDFELEHQPASRVATSEDIVHHKPESPKWFEPPKSGIHVGVTREIRSGETSPRSGQQLTPTVVWPFGGDSNSHISTLSWLDSGRDSDEHSGRGLSAPPSQDLGEARYRRR